MLRPAPPEKRHKIRRKNVLASYVDVDRDVTADGRERQKRPAQIRAPAI